MVRSGVLFPCHGERGVGPLIGYDDDARATLLANLEPLATSREPFKASRLINAKWYQPKLMVRVKHLAGSKTLRHSTVKGYA